MSKKRGNKWSLKPLQEMGVITVYDSLEIGIFTLLLSPANQLGNFYRDRISIAAAIRSLDLCGHLIPHFIQRFNADLCRGGGSHRFNSTLQGPALRDHRNQFYSEVQVFLPPELLPFRRVNNVHRQVGLRGSFLPARR